MKICNQGYAPLRCLHSRTPHYAVFMPVELYNLQPSNLQPSTFNLQPSTFNLQPSTFNLQPSTFNLQPSTFNLQPSTFQPSTFNLPTFN
jgi:hypothetical protein